MELQHGGFEAGGWRETRDGVEYPEIYPPIGWIAYWEEDVGNQLYRPEMKTIAKEPPYLDPPRVYEGDFAFQYFKQWGLIDAGVYQQVEVDGPGELAVSVQAHAWYSQRDNAHKSEYQDENGDWHTIHHGDEGVDLMLGIDPEGGTDQTSDTVQWTTGRFYDSYEQLSLAVDIPLAGTVTIFLRAKNQYPFKHVDVYWDSVSSEFNPVELERGEPRVQYKRTYVLLPDDIEEEEVAEEAISAHSSRKTLGYSADDAGIGDLDERNVEIVWRSENSWDEEAIENFFATYYPGVNSYHVRRYEPVGPPDPPEKQEIDLRSGNLVGLHSGYPKEGWDEYLTQALPTVQKCFSSGFALDAKQLAPDALIVWRRHADNDVQVEEPIVENVNRLLDLYQQELETMARNNGKTYDEVLSLMDGIVIESLNEQIPTFVPDKLVKAVEFDRLFCELVTERFEGHLRPGVLTAAIGNPHESEVHYLIPAVRAAIENNGLIGYHGYWTANRGQDWLLEYWGYHAGRWTEWDKVFRAEGLYPEYYIGEGGIVYTFTGTDFHSGKGWKSCGSFENYLVSLNKFRDKTIEWNAVHGNRCHGLTVFGFGNWGWDDFEIGTGDLELMRQYALENWI
jgi:hypothetical protein